MLQMEQTRREDAMNEESILKIEDLHVHFQTDLGISRALNGINLEIPNKKVMGIVGESGCGKSIMALSIMQLVPPPGKLSSGRIILRQYKPEPRLVEVSALGRHSKEMRAIRGGQIGMIFQEPMTSLNPSYTIGDQIAEAVLLHHTDSKQQALNRAVETLDKVGMPSPREVVNRYPHELSGGMRQRVMIAMALSCSPSILIADEPTTALDVTTEAQILDLIRDLQAELGMTTIFITHNLGVVAQMCDNVAVMYLGRVVEQGPVVKIFYEPLHPYTKALLTSIPRIGSSQKGKLQPIHGMVPDPYAKVIGCPFHPRCNNSKPGVCDKEVPAFTSISEDHSVRCFLYSDKVEQDDGI